MQGRTNSTSVYSKNTNATFTENGIYIPSEGFTGFGVVTVDTPTSSDLIMQEDYDISPEKMDFTNPEEYQWTEHTPPYIDSQQNSYDGVANIKVRKIGSWIDNNINADNIKQGTTILGINGHVIEVNNEENKHVKSTNSTQEILPISGKTGFSNIIVDPLDPIVTEDLTADFYQTSSTTYPYTYTFSRSQNKYINTASITIHEPPEPPPPPVYVTTDLIIDPQITLQTFDPTDPEYNADGFGIITVKPVTSDIDKNIQRQNIAPGVTILGVEGNYSPPAESKTTKASGIQNVTVTPSSGYVLNEVVVEQVDHTIDQNIIAENIKQGVTVLDVTGTYNGPNYQIETVEHVQPEITSKTITPSQGYDYLDSVQIDAVTHTIDQNIQAENIKEGITILGVEGTFATQTVKTQAQKTVSPETIEKHVFADSGYDAITELIVRAVDSGIDLNIVAENIKKNITILGVRGTLDATQHWFDFQDQKGFTVLTSDTFGNGQFAPSLEAGLTDYVITYPFDYGQSLPIEDLGAVIFTNIIGYESLEVTDPITYQSYIYFKGGRYYSDYNEAIIIENQISYLYPVINNKNINGCLLNCEDISSEKIYNIYVLIGSKAAKPVLVDGPITNNMLPEGYNDYRFAGTITVPNHNVFIPIETAYSNKYDLPTLFEDGIIGGDNFAVAASGSQSSICYPYKAFNKQNLDANTDCWYSTNRMPQWLEMYFPEKVYINKIYISNRCFETNAVVAAIRGYTIQVSTNGIDWTNVYSGTNSNFNFGATWEINLNTITQSSKYWRIYITDTTTGSGSSSYVIIGEIEVDAFLADSLEPQLWEQPSLSSSTSYGIVTNGDKTLESDEAFQVFSDLFTIDLSDFSYTLNNSQATVNSYIGNENNVVLPGYEPATANFIPELTGSYIKWQMPNDIKLVFSKDISTIKWQHNDSSIIMSGTPLQIFADENKTIPLTEPFADPDGLNKEIIIPVIRDYATDVIYINIASHENYGGIGNIHFNNLYLARNITQDTIKSWLLINPSISKNIITSYTKQNNTPLLVNISAFDTDFDKPTIFFNKKEETSDIIFNNGVGLKDGIVSGFSQNRYCSVAIGLNGILEITMRAYCAYSSYTAQYLISDISGSGFGIYNTDSNNRYCRICDVNNATNGSINTGFTNNAWHWIKFIQTGTTSEIYTLLDDGTYTTINELPSIEDPSWTQALLVEKQIFKGGSFFIGCRLPNQSNINEYWRNSIDLNNFEIKMNNVVCNFYKTYNCDISNHVVIPRQDDLYFVSVEDAPTKEDYAHVYGYIDNGNATIINIYAVYDKNLNKRTYLFAPNDSISFTNRFDKLCFVDSINIPAHIPYRFDTETQSWIPKE